MPDFDIELWAGLHATMLFPQSFGVQNGPVAPVNGLNTRFLGSLESFLNEIDFEKDFAIRKSALPAFQR